MIQSEDTKFIISKFGVSIQGIQMYTFDFVASF